MNYLKDLQEFHRSAFRKSGYWPADIGQEFIPDNITARLREHLIAEETNELANVLMGDDDDCSKEHLLKEICDVLYVTFGTAVAYFKPEVVEEAFKRVHSNNLLKLETADISEYGKFKKSPNHPKVVLSDLVNNG